MARPTKQGIDYFPLDCQFDDKIEMFLIEKGATGLGVLVTIWQMIYSNEGYYIVDNKDLHLLIKRKIDVDINEVSGCINICLERNVFNADSHKNYGILTSKAIQKRFFEAAKKKKTVQINKDYIINGIDSYDNWVNVSGNATKVNVKEKVKVKEDKKKPKPIKTAMPKDFGISERVQTWANKKQFTNLDCHLENFKLACEAKGYKYDNWDSAFMNAIRNNWAKVSIVNPDNAKPQLRELAS